jgi:hypothetical protein
MAPKKLKKLVLKKDIVSNLRNGEMNQVVGGYDPTRTDTGNSVVVCPSRTTCLETVCYPCPVHSQIGSGCDGETCGVAYTCNG